MTDDGDRMSVVAKVWDSLPTTRDKLLFFGALGGVVLALAATAFVGGRWLGILAGEKNLDSTKAGYERKLAQLENRLSQMSASPDPLEGGEVDGDIEMPEMESPSDGSVVPTTPRDGESDTYTFDISGTWNNPDRRCAYYVYSRAAEGSDWYCMGRIPDTKHGEKWAMKGTIYTTDSSYAGYACVVASTATDLDTEGSPNFSVPTLEELEGFKAHSDWVSGWLRAWRNECPQQATSAASRKPVKRRRSHLDWGSGLEI
ncbi:MAG: hypothetical protein HQ582_32150 [Planctomycetes bacterium]|nr:hypothetical protein [Planctomycetota bacterium]